MSTKYINSYFEGYYEIEKKCIYLLNVFKMLFELMIY